MSAYEPPNDAKLLSTERVAIVTGGSGSIGAGICQSLATSGMHVVVNYLTNSQGAFTTVENIKKLGGEALAIQADVSQPDQVEHMVQETTKEFGRLDILVNCAGIALANFVADMNLAEWEQVLDINLTGVFLCTRAVLPFMIERKSGQIINIASMVAETGSYRHAHYAASKAAVIAFTKSLAKEVGQFGIRVNAINPGRIRSEMEADRQKNEQAQWITETPLGRLGEPQEIGDLVTFLCSEKAAFITGETIQVNGGLLMV